MRKPLATLAFLTSTAATGAFAQQDEASCTALANTAIDGGYVHSARVVDAGAEGAPAYCEVRATALPAINIEVRLPMADWNGKYYQAGCGGLCGILGRADASPGWVNAMRPGLERGYATATSDSGHHGLSVADATWADHNPQAERDWGWRSIGETHRVAQAMIAAFYDAPSEQAIFQGCSTGGRMAHMAAQRYPETFQGIISGAPALDYTGLVGTQMSYLMQTNTDASGEQILKPEKIGLLADEVLARCDGADGAEDGSIADPAACEIDLSGLACTADGAEDCLTEAEIGVVEAWRAGPRNAAGDQLYPGGVPAGSEPFWPLWLVGFEGGGGNFVGALADQFGRYMAFPDDPGADWTVQDFDLESDPERMAEMGAVYNSDQADLAEFRAAGGKMIVWHGWADPIVTPGKTVDWFEAAAEAAGGQETLEENVRLFMIPGLDHCGIQEGPAGITSADLDPMGPLEAWLNDGTAPDGIMAE